MTGSAEPSSRGHDQAMSLVIQLRGIPLLSQLSAEQLLPVAHISKEASYPAEQVIFEKGDQANHLYLITRGSVEVLSGDTRVATLGAGECFGEMAMLEHTTRSATIRTLEDCRLVATARKDFHDLLALYPALGRSIAAVLVQRVRAALESNSM